MTGTFVVVVMGSAVIVGASIGSAIGWTLDKYRTKPGRHRTGKAAVRSGLVMTLPALMLFAAMLPNGPDNSKTMHRTSDLVIGAQMGGTS